MILSKIIPFSRTIATKPPRYSQIRNGLAVLRRHGSGGPRMLRAKTDTDTGLKGLVIRYLIIGAVPAILIISYCNLFIGDAVLYDHDPDLYEPEHYEYYKHPITRFLARYVMEDPKLSYYKDIFALEIAQRDERQNRLVNQVEKLQKLEQEGMIEWQNKPTVSRALLDQLDEYAEKNLKGK